MIRVYLDSNAIVSLVFDDDTYVRSIVNAAKKHKIKAYVSWLTLSEVTGFASRTETDSRFLSKIRNTLKANEIQIITDSDRSLSSGSALTTAKNLDYSDHLHLLLAKRAYATHFVTYDSELLSKKRFGSIKILDPRSFALGLLET